MSQTHAPIGELGEPIAIPPTGPVDVRRLPIRFESDDSRVITLPFLTTWTSRIRTVFERLGAMSEDDVARVLQWVMRDYGSRHRNIQTTFEENFRFAVTAINWDGEWSKPRRLLAGAYCTMEYAIESAALFNPSIVRHTNQDDVAPGGERFLMSLRATGEGHISSIVFRSGVINPDASVTMDPPARVLARARSAPDRHYVKHLFRRKLRDLSVKSPVVDTVLDALPDKFTLHQLREAVRAKDPDYAGDAKGQSAVDSLLWLARSNYHIDLAPESDISELVIYPIAAEEARGIEDLRLVRFVDDDQTATYYGTYTAYNGERTVPMLMETTDFRRIEFHSLNGACALNKGMALFPRKIGGHYVMCGRIDGENLYIMYSDYVAFWESAKKLAEPRWPWELVQLGNCGSPLETPEGWLLLTHGVGPMREYCIGAMLLDLEDPLKIIGHLRRPLISGIGDEREGYVPNVVYTCGAMIHDDLLYLPFALADKATAFAVVHVDELINVLLHSPVEGGSGK